MVQLTLPARARCAGVAAKVVLPWRVGGGEGSDRKPSNTGEKHQDNQELPRAVGWRVSSGDPPSLKDRQVPLGVGYKTRSVARRSRQRNRCRARLEELGESQ